MGGLCSKQEGDPFAQPGRRLDSAPPARTSAPTSSVPGNAAKPKIGGPPRTLGGGGGGASSSSDADDARRRAAAAAEVSQLERRFEGNQVE